MQVWQSCCLEKVDIIWVEIRWTAESSVGICYDSILNSVEIWKFGQMLVFTKSSINEVIQKMLLDSELFLCAVSVVMNIVNSVRC